MDTIAAIDMTIKAAEATKEFKENYSKIKYVFNWMRPSIKVLVVGESGSGKTQFLASIRDKKEYVDDRTKVSVTRTLTLPNGRRVEFCDTPGHKSLKAERGRKINKIASGKFDGIINIVCYGYQSAENIDTSNIFKGGEIKEEFLELNREKESQQVQEWLGRIYGDSKVKWVLTIVNKADVWWKNYEDVMSHYEEGSTYNDTLQDIARISSISSLPYCSVISPLFGKPMTIVFGEKDKYALYDRFQKHLIDLING